jgi:hypothetical protein
MVSTGFFNNFFGQVKKTSSIKSKKDKPKSDKSKKDKPKSTFIPPKGSVKYKKYYFIDIKRSKNPERKYDAKFIKGPSGREKIISFGKKGNPDFISTQDREQREFYDYKHKTATIKDLMSREALEKFILWNKSSLESSIRDYKRRL